MAKKYIDQEMLLTELARQDADVVADYGQEYGVEWGYSRENIENIANTLPAADVVEVVHGRWLEIQDDFDGGHWQCSACGVEWAFLADGPVENKANYCPACGADLRPEPPIKQEGQP